MAVQDRGQPEVAMGIHCGTHGVFGSLIDVTSGSEVATARSRYRHGADGILSFSEPGSARQHPADYIHAVRLVMRRLVRRTECRLRRRVGDAVIGVGVASTGSTALPVDAHLQPLAFDDRFAADPAALTWLWKDETSTDEALEVTVLAQRLRPEYLAACGGAYSSEGYFSKILRCLHTNRAVFDAAYSWIEVASWIPAVLTGQTSPEGVAVDTGTAGHNAMFDPRWGGYPDRDFLGRLAPEMVALRDRLPKRALPAGSAVGGLSRTWAENTGLRPGTAVSVGGLDTHLCALGVGIGPGVVAQVEDCTRCSLLTVASHARKLSHLSGWGIADGSILPRYHGLAARLKAGDVWGWYVDSFGGSNDGRSSISDLLRACHRMAPGEAGLVMLCDLGEPGQASARREISLLIGQKQSTRPEDILRALLEAEAFRLVRYLRVLEVTGIATSRIAACGLPREDGRVVSQILADALGCPVVLFPFSRTAARGAAMSGGVAAGRGVGGHGGLRAAQTAMGAPGTRSMTPRPATKVAYARLFGLHARLVNAYGTSRWHSECKRALVEMDVMHQAIVTG